MYGKTNADQLRIFLINVHGKSKSKNKKKFFVHLCSGSFSRKKEEVCYIKNTLVLLFYLSGYTRLDFF